MSQAQTTFSRNLSPTSPGASKRIRPENIDRDEVRKAKTSQKRSSNPKRPHRNYSREDKANAIAAIEAAGSFRVPDLAKLLLTSSKRSSMRPPRFLSPKIPKLSPNGASKLLIYLIFRSFDLKQSFSVYWSQNSESNQNLREIHEEDVIFKQGVVVRSEQQNSSQFVRRCLLR